MFIFTPDKYSARKVSLSLFNRRVSCPVTPFATISCTFKFQTYSPHLSCYAELPLNKQHILAKEAVVAQVLTQEVATISNVQVYPRLGG